MAKSGLTIMFEHCNDRSLCPGPGTASSCSSPTNFSPSTPVGVYPLSPLDVSVESEDTWNLIPYDVPWGQEYYHYHAGTLPGPDGTCVFLRSPTPLKNRRTQKACNKCRQRKAKCSGTHPKCTRCVARDYDCEYVEEQKRVPSHISRRRRYESTLFEPLDGPSSPSHRDSFRDIQSKVEDLQPSTPDLLYFDGDTSYDSTSPTDYNPPWENPHLSYATSAPYVYESTADFYVQPSSTHEYFEPSAYPVTDASRSYHYSHPQVASPMYQQLPQQHHVSASVHAPRPVRCAGSPSFLSPHERATAFAFPSTPHEMISHNPVPQIAIPQVPPMPPTVPALEQAASQYEQPQGAFYYPAAEQVLQYPMLQYQYDVPTYPPTGMHDAIDSGMLYTMLMLPAGMTA